MRRDELRNLPHGALVATLEGDILAKSGRNGFVVLSAGSACLRGDHFFVGGIAGSTVFEIGGEYEARIRAALAEIDAVRREIGDTGQP